MAEQTCFKEHGVSTRGWVKKCLLCSSDDLSDEQCIKFRECIRKNRAELPDKSVRLLKNIDVVTEQSPADRVAVLIQPDESHEGGCNDPSDEKFARLLKSDCGCLQEFHDRCDNEKDQQACLRQVACEKPDTEVCKSWKDATNNATGKKNCDNALIERSARDDTSRHAATLARSEAFKGMDEEESLDESLTLKRTCR